MADEKAPNPTVQFAEWVTQWERSVDEFSNKMMGTDEFSKSMNQMQNVQMEFQRSFGEAMARQLATFNMPSRDDVIRVAEDLREVERRLGHIERHLEKLVRQNDHAVNKKVDGPRRTKQPPQEISN